MTEYVLCCLKLEPRRGKNIFEPHLSNEILLPFTVFFRVFENFRQAPPSFLYGTSPGNVSCSVSRKCLVTCCCSQKRYFMFTNHFRLYFFKGLKEASDCIACSRRHERRNRVENDC